MKTDQATISSADLCELLDMSRTTLSDYVERGAVKPLRRGVFPYPDAVTAIVRSLRKSAATRGTPVSAEDDKRRLVRAQADMAEIELARQKGELWRKELALHVFGEQITVTRARLLAIPTRAAPTVLGCATVAEVAAKLQDEVHEALRELSEEFGATEIERQTNTEINA